VASETKCSEQDQTEKEELDSESLFCLLENMKSECMAVESKDNWVNLTKYMVNGKSVNLV
jgi:hypothetical protein